MGELGRGLEWRLIGEGKGVRRHEGAKARMREGATTCDGLHDVSPGIGGVATGADAGELLDHSRDVRPARGRGDKHGPRRRFGSRVGMWGQTSV